MNTAIIVAAGSGQRFGSERPKQFMPLAGKPLILHTLEKFEACPAIHRIVLVLSEDGREAFSNLKFEISNLKLVTGGTTRAESVRNGLVAIESETAEIVAVHDGARPLVTVDEIERTVNKASEVGAACLVADVNDTIKQIDNGLITKTIDRKTLRRALTPQAFRYDILRRAFDGADLSEAVTDECYLIEKLGVDIAIVEGSSMNIKITRPEDTVLAEILMDKGKVEKQLTADS